MLRVATRVVDGSILVLAEMRMISRKILRKRMNLFGIWRKWINIWTQSIRSTFQKLDQNIRKFIYGVTVIHIYFSFSDFSSHNRKIVKTNNFSATLYHVVVNWKSNSELQTLSFYQKFQNLSKLTIFPNRPYFYVLNENKLKEHYDLYCYL